MYDSRLASKISIPVVDSNGTRFACWLLANILVGIQGINLDGNSANSELPTVGWQLPLVGLTLEFIQFLRLGSNNQETSPFAK